MLTLDRIYHAAYVLKDAIRPTDMIKCSADVVPGTSVYLKTENLQVTGSFKVRGAYYKISQLTEEERKKGVIACSAGNHAQGVARAATKNGIKSLICIPDAAPISKIEATKRLGAEVCLVKGTYDDAYAKAVELQKQSGAVFIHPFDDELVIAGQGTIGLEIIDKKPNVDAVVVPVGGGGLLAGVAFAIKSLNPDIKVYGVQASGAPSMVQSVKDGQIETLESVHTFQDGIAVKTPGNLTYEIASKYVDGFVTVTDDECAAAILTLLERQKLVTEGAGACAFAAVLFNKIPEIKGKRVCCLLSGGNIDVTILSRVINRGLQMSGRLADLTIELLDKPGQLQGVSEIISNMGGNVVSVSHDRAELNSDINACFLRISMETRNQAHVDEIKAELVKNGYRLV
ncbi:MAG: threonine ammonia-lyase [Ruminococcus sp.]|nr:threonine ammonia-lyase [Ruminococcus sp.]MDD6446296.1 threonine ammonia-lyase [Ruminococcus sp.]MDY2855809.1 threonine ammonia-lyase [Oscillospiraceae bacterium]